MINTVCPLPSCSCSLYKLLWGQTLCHKLVSHCCGGVISQWINLLGGAGLVMGLVALIAIGRLIFTPFAVISGVAGVSGTCVGSASVGGLWY